MAGSGKKKKGKGEGKKEVSLDIRAPYAKKRGIKRVKFLRAISFLFFFTLRVALIKSFFFFDGCGGYFDSAFLVDSLARERLKAARMYTQNS